MFIDGLKQKAIDLAIDRIIQNLGLIDIVENPKNYKVEFYVDDEDAITMKVKQNDHRR